jgi:hypothetical protein
MGATLWQPLTDYRTARGVCNPAMGVAAPGMRWCGVVRDSVPVMLGFLSDSLVQVSYSTLRRGSHANASAVWQGERDSLSAGLGRPPDTIAIRPARGAVVRAGPDPRGDSAQVLTAIWRRRPDAPWCAKILLTDQPTPGGEPLTRTTVDLFALSSAGAGPVRHCSPD